MTHANVFHPRVSLRTTYRNHLLENNLLVNLVGHSDGLNLLSFHVSYLCYFTFSYCILGPSQRKCVEIGKYIIKEVALRISCFVEALHLKELVKVQNSFLFCSWEFL